MRHWEWNSASNQSTSFNQLGKLNQMFPEKQVETSLNKVLANCDRNRTEYNISQQHLIIGIYRH